MLDTVPLGVLLFEPDGRLSFNRRTEEILGMTLSPTGGSAQYSKARALKHGETSIGETIRIERLDGSLKTILHSALPLHDDQGRPAGAILVDEDITGLKEVEDALRRAVQSRDATLGIVAHDLRVPLTAISLQIQRLRLKGYEPDHCDKATEVIQRQVTRMNKLIQDLLDVASIDAGALSLSRARVHTDELLAEVMEAQRPLVAASSLDLRLDAHGPLPDLCADRDRLLRVFENLIGNACKFTKPGGHITVGAAPDGGDVLFRVSDTGSGIPAELLPHVFDQFWQASRKDRRGAGLGLAIVKGIVEAHGGSVRVESEVGIGTTFFFTVPVAGGVGQGG